MDGVLIDSEILHYKALNNVMAAWQVTIYDEEYNTYVGTKTIEMCEKLVKRYHLPVTARQLAAEKTRRYLEDLHNDATIAPIPGVEELIADLHSHGVPLALASSSYRDVIQAVLNKFGLERYFRAIVSGDQVASGKPDPEIFLEASARLEIPPARCAVVEDSANGVEAAKAAGMFCIGFINPGSGEQNLSAADILTDDFTTLSYARISGKGKSS